jgi:hypothetical protein
MKKNMKKLGTVGMRTLIQLKITALADQQPIPKKSIS